MSLKIVFALVFVAALCCAQTDGTSSAGIPAKITTDKDAPTPNPPAAPAAEAGAAAPVPPRSDPTPRPAPNTAAQQKVPAGKPGTSAKKAYVIGSLDVLFVKVWNNPNLSGTVSVSSDGMISMALIGDIKADGLTARELKDSLTEHLKDFLINPEVNVEVAKINSKRYYVYGGVGKTGEYPLIEETTVMDALSGVGSFTGFANKKKIRIQRTLPSGETKDFKFNFEDVSKGKHMDTNIVIENGDRIFVPE
jgi:polysaccharide export outer membrane protein